MEKQILSKETQRILKALKQKSSQSEETIIQRLIEEHFAVGISDMTNAHYEWFQGVGNWVRCDDCYKLVKRNCIYSVWNESGESIEVCKECSNRSE